MLVVALALGRAATSVDAVQRFDAAAVRELQGEIAVRGLERRVFAVTDLGGSPMLLVGVAAALTLLAVGRWLGARSARRQRRRRGRVTG